MVVSCCVINCANRFDKADPKSFYRIPKKPDERRELWIKAIKRATTDGQAWIPSDHDRVCYLHFIQGEKSNDKHSPDYVPSVNMGYKVAQVSGELRFARHIRVGLRTAEKDRRDVAAALLDLSFKENAPEPEEPQPYVDCHETCIKKIADLRIENQQLHSELARLQAENEELLKKTTIIHFADSVLMTDRKTSFYTGTSSAVFLWLLAYCSCVLPTSKVLTPKSVLMCLLMKLRLNLQHQDLAYRFNVSVTTISEVLNQGLPKLAEKLAFLIQWPDKDSLIRNMPNVFKKTYRKCVSIIDCFEVFIQRPGQLTARCQTWSNYKHNNTVKFLVSISPTGAITYVSKAYGGRTSDKVITQRSGYLDKLEYGDQVLADRGFLISEDVTSRNASLVIPAFTRGKSQLSAKEVEQTRKIAHVRIHVERAIERLKNYNILSSSLSMHMVPHIDSIVTICSSLCNLQPKLVT